MFKQICGDRDLHSYTIKDVEHFKLKRMETCSPVTVNIAFRALRSVFNHAIKMQLIDENPFQKSSQIKVPERLPVFMSKTEFIKLLFVVKEPELKDLYLFAVMTGLRLGEILNLQWNSIDMERRLIMLLNSAHFSTKSGKCHAIPMNDAVYEILSRRFLIRIASDYVFHRKGRQLQESYVSHKFKKYIRQLGLNEKLHFRSLRHTFASWLVQDGVSLYEVQKLLGHSNISVTQFYGHLQPERLHSTVNRISIALN
jgi:site-specific recombinase XerD